MWDASTLVFVAIEGPDPFDMVALVTSEGGVVVDTLGIADPGAVDHITTGADTPVAMQPATEVPVAEALTTLAQGLRESDMAWPRLHDDSVVDLRALAWSFSRGHEAGPPSSEPLSDEGRRAILADFESSTSGTRLSEPARSLSDLFLDYGAGYFRSDALAWSPGWVEEFLLDYVPRKVTLGDELSRSVPEGLRAWVEFALARRGVEQRWIDPVVAQVDALAVSYRQAMAGETPGGPAKQVVTYLLDRGVDLTDRDAVATGIAAFNADPAARAALDLD